MSATLDLESMISNLNILRERETVIKELRALTIKDFQLSLTDHPDIRDLVRTYRRYMPIDNTIFTLTDRIEFCKKIQSCAKTNIEHLLFKEKTNENINTVTYVKNQYSSNALSKLREHITIQNERAFRSFSEMCDDIESGIYDDCIIPLENTTNGKLMNFYSIIDRFDLKIVMTCDVENQSGDQITRYALLRRNIILPQNTGNCCLEFSFTASEYFNIKDILDAAALVDLSLYRMDSMPLRYNESAFIYYPVLYGTPQNIILFLLFLKLNSLQYNMIGMYYRIQ